MKEYKERISKIKKVCLSVASCLATAFLVGANVYPAISASADVLEVNENVAVIGTAGDGVIDVSDYKVEIKVNENSTINVSENITVEFLENDATNFYRKIFKDVEDLTRVSVFCEGNEAFSYGIIAGNNETTIECYGGVELGAVWTYQFNYTVKADEAELGNELVFNIIGEGWPTTVENVEAEISLPDSILAYDAYCGDETSKSDVTASVSEDGKSLIVSSRNRETEMASSAITVKITLPNETLIQDFDETMELAQQSEIVLLISIVPYVIIAVLILVFGIMAVAV